MENDTDKRIESLELEVRALRLEINELKGIKEEYKDIENQLDPPSHQPLEEAEKHLVKLNKAASAKLNKNHINEVLKNTESAPKRDIEPLAPKKQRTIEEVILWLLPKVFMIILVLGVLWGLKVISDFGLLSNELKIALAYGLSIGLIIVGILMDMKKPETSQIFTNVLYGGAFIIGILSTAAGAILYDVLGLYFALLLALVFIAYGIAICYVKKNEVLSIFVIFTSLLLPYLLEYMDLNGVIILLYVLVVYGFMQYIVIKHIQTIAMFISFIFSMIAIQILWSLNDDSAWLYVLSHILLNSIFLMVWWQSYKPFSKWRAIYEGLLFSLMGLTILMINLISDYAAFSLLLLTVIYGILTIIAHKRSASRVVDIAGTLSLLTIINSLMVVNAINHLEIIILPLSAFLGLLVGLKLNAKLMQIMYSLLFTLFVLVHLLVNDIRPFWTTEHLNYFLIFIYLISLFLYIKKHSKDELSKSGIAKVNFSMDIFPIFLVVYFFIYVFKFDVTYVAYDYHAYLTALVLALTMMISLFISEKIIGRALRYILIFAFLITCINLIPIHFVDAIDIWLNLIVRIIYAMVVIAVVADVYMKGYLYRKWISHLNLDSDGLLTIGIVGAMVLLYSLLSQIQFDNLLNYYLVVTAKTLLLFITASISLWMSTKGLLRKVKAMGYCILAIAIMKLIFSDLDSLNLLIRAFLFMIIGGIGLFLSNRLLSNNIKSK